MPRTATGTAYDLSGPEDAPVVVLVHGLGLNRRVWQWHLPALEARYRVLNYDLCGHGESAMPEGDLTLTSFSGQLRDVMDAAEVQDAAILGFSLGGMINRRLAMDHPERVRALGILNSPHERSPEAQKLAEENAAQAQAGGPGAVLDTVIRRWFTAGYIAENPGVIAQVQDWLLVNNPDHYAKARRVLAHGVVELIRPEPPVTKPTLVITSENDTGSTPAMSKAIASEIPGAEVLIVPGVQHMGLVERPDDFLSPMLGFFDRALPL